MIPYKCDGNESVLVTCSQVLRGKHVTQKQVFDQTSLSTGGAKENLVSEDLEDEASHYDAYPTK